MPASPLHPTASGSPQLRSAAAGQAWWCAGPNPVAFEIAGASYVAEVKSGLVSSPYASVADVLAISVPEDQGHDFADATLNIWLRVGAAKIHEYLGQRFAVPLSVWSDTVVWANCELAYFGAARRRGLNTEAMLADFRAREDAVLSWLKSSRDHEITPDQRLSTQDQPVQALRYIGPESRGWDAGRGGWR